MSKIGKFSTHHVPDQGVWYATGDVVRIDQSGRQVVIVKDPNGDHEVHSCRRATEYGGNPELLRVGLRKSAEADRVELAPRLHAI